MKRTSEQSLRDDLSAAEKHAARAQAKYDAADRRVAKALDDRRHADEARASARARAERIAQALEILGAQTTLDAAVEPEAAPTEPTPITRKRRA